MPPSRELGPVAMLVQRCVIAGAVFSVAALVLGVNLVGGLECLALFLVTSLLVNAYQRRSAVIRSPRRRPRSVRAPARQAQSSPPDLWDDDAVDRWPLLAEQRR